MDCRKFFPVLFIILISIFVTFMPSYACAEEAIIKKRPSDSRKVEETPDEARLTREEVRKMALEYAKESLQKVEYFVPTIDNLSKLYWALGMFNLDDIGAIDYYLMINECQIYTDYYHDDFEWKNILETARKYLKDNRSQFPRRFSFMKEIDLGRYNFKTESFYVITDDLRNGTRRHEMRLGSTLDKVCGFSGKVPGYPRNLNVTLSRPFRLQYVPISPEKAQDFVIRTRYQHREDTETLRSTSTMSLYERKAYVRIRVRILKFLGYERNSQGEEIASVFAVLEGYDVFEDQEGEKIIFTTGN